MDTDTTRPEEEQAAKSPGMIGRESDDLPSLVISDSDEDEAAKPTAAEGNNVDEPKTATDGPRSEDISGITPIDETAIRVDATADEGVEKNEHETTNAEKIAPSTSEQSLSAADEAADSSSVLENIDLTAISSAEESFVSDPGVEPETDKKEQTKSMSRKKSSDMTAQELLQSLLGAQEAALSAQMESANYDTVAEKSDMIKFIDVPVNEQHKECQSKDISTIALDDTTKIILDEVEPTNPSSSIAVTAADTSTQNASMAIDNADAETNALKRSKDTDSGDATCASTPDTNSPNTMDDDCLLEEMPQMAESQSDKNLIEDAMETDSPTSSEGSGTDQNNGVEQKCDTLEGSENPDVHKITEETDNEPDSSEPPRKRLRSSDMDGLLPKEVDNKKEQSTTSSCAKVAMATGLSNNFDILIIDDDEDVDAKSDQCQNKEKTNQCVKTMCDYVDDKLLKNAHAPLKLFQQADRPSVQSDAGQKSEPVALDFLRRFVKPLSQLTRDDLEQLVLQKISEALIHKSEVAEMRKDIHKQHVKLQDYERLIGEMETRYKALKIITEKAVEEMRQRAHTYVAPVKITRGVGLQVTAIGASADPTTSYSKPKPVDEVSAHSTEAGSRYDETVGMTRHLIQQRSSNGKRTSSSNVNRTTVSDKTTPIGTAPNVPQVANSIPTGMVRSGKSHGIKQNNGSINTSIATAVSAKENRTLASKTDTGVMLNGAASDSDSSCSSTNTSTGSTGDKALRKTNMRHKFTPMRPPFSPYQQALQEKQARQQQEMLVQQINEQSLQVQRKSQQSARQDTPNERNSATAAPINIIAGQRPIAVQHQNRYVLITAQPSDNSASQLVSTSTLRTSSSNVSSTTSLAPPVRVGNASSPAVSSSSVNDSLIDLTDEDDTPRNSLSSNGTTQAPKRPRLPTSQTLTSSPTTPNAPSPNSLTAQVATAQLLRLQQRSVNADVSTTNSSIGAAYQQNGSAVLRASLTKRTAVPPLQLLRQPNQSNGPRLPTAPNDTALLKKRVHMKASNQGPTTLVPLPLPGPQPHSPAWKLSPPQPAICVNNVQTGIVISWSMPTLTDLHATIENYQIYAYQEVSSTSAGSEEWRHVGDVRALLLPMAVTLTQFQEGQRYHFAVRAIDVHKRVGYFSEPRTWNDTNTPSF